MKRTPRWLIAFAVSLMALSAAGAAEEPSVVSAPLQGVVAHGRTLAMYVSGPGMFDRGFSGLRHAPLAGGPARDGCRPAIGVPPHVWQVAHGYLWTSDNQEASGINDVLDVLYRYRVDGFLEDKWITTAEVDEQSLWYSSFIVDSPLWCTRTQRIRVEYKFELYYDFLPTAENAVILFQLCNVAGTDRSGLPGLADSAIGWKVTPAPRKPVPDDEAHKQPPWSLAMFGCQKKWDAKAEKWPLGKWERIGQIDVAFHEQFHVLGKGDDYYFVTDSGKLYRSPKPEKDSDRKMETVWDDKKQPIVSFITDADAERTFLFCQPDKDGKGVYFEMSDKPAPQPYDASKIPEAKVADQLPAVLAYAKILLADKKIKDKE